MLIKYVKSVSPKEKRLYRILSLIFLSIWLVCAVQLYGTDYAGPLVWMGIPAGILAATFGCAYSQAFRIWPFYLFFEEQE